MKICVVGAGGIGGLLAARLAQSGEEVTVIARGPHLAAIRANGLKLIEEDGREIVSRIAATDKIADVSEQDLVILGMKAHQVAAVVRDLPAMYGPRHRRADRAERHSLVVFLAASAVRTKAGASKASIPAASSPTIFRLSACSAASFIPLPRSSEPGVIKHIEGNRFSIAEIDNSKTERISAYFRGAAEGGLQGAGRHAISAPRSGRSSGAT